MTAFTPAYRARVYVPRSVDPNEAVLLRPAANAWHNDAFQVASIQGVAGYQPYLQAFPTGRRGSLDILTKRIDVSELVLSFLDKRMEGGMNAQRWVTAFIGDARGRTVGIGCRVEVDESLDNGQNWSRFFTGRIDNSTLNGPLVFEATCVDISKDMNARVFTGVYGDAAPYAFPSPILPVQPFGGGTLAYGINLSTEDPTVTLKKSLTHLDGKVAAPRVERSYDNNLVLQFIDPLRSANKPKGNFITAPLQDLADEWYQDDAAHFGTVGIYRRGQVRVRLRWQGGSGEYDLAFIRSINLFDSDGTVSSFAVVPAGTPLPPQSTAVTFAFVLGNVEPIKSAPLYLWDVHPVQLWADVLDGRFARKLPNGQIPRSAMFARDTAAFDALIADKSFIPGRFIITQSAKVNEWIEDNICVPWNLAYRIGPDGAVIPLDLRRSNTLETVPTIAAAALAGGTRGHSWETGRKGAATWFTVKAYFDYFGTTKSAAASTTPGSGLQGVANSLKDFKAGLSAPFTRDIIDPGLDAASLDIGMIQHTIDAVGFRFGSRGTNGEPAREEAITASAVALMAELRALIGSGPLVHSRSFRRNDVSGVFPGMWRKIDIPESPNPASNTRGGLRIGLCVDRVEDGAVIVLTFLDGGASTVAVSPALSNLTMNNGVPRVSVTPNVANEPVELQFITTPTSVGSLPNDAAGWRAMAITKQPGLVSGPPIPGGLRVWVRGRSVPLQGTAFKLPSPWTTPTPAFVDSTGVGAPSGLAVSLVGRNAATLSWTNASATLPIAVFLTVGNAAPAGGWTRDLQIVVLPEGTTRYRLRGLDGPSAQHVVALRHMDGFGGYSAAAELAFTTGTVNATLPRPAGIDFAIPRS